MEHPSLAKEGWLRPLRKSGEASLPGADGHERSECKPDRAKQGRVVRSSHRLSEVGRTTRPRFSKERGHTNFPGSSLRLDMSFLLSLHQGRDDALRSVRVAFEPQCRPSCVSLAISRRASIQIDTLLKIIYSGYCGFWIGDSARLRRLRLQNFSGRSLNVLVRTEISPGNTWTVSSSR